MSYQYITFYIYDYKDKIIYKELDFMAFKTENYI